MCHAYGVGRREMYYRWKGTVLAKVRACGDCCSGGVVVKLAWTAHGSRRSAVVGCPVLSAVLVASLRACVCSGASPLRRSYSSARCTASTKHPSLTSLTPNTPPLQVWNWLCYYALTGIIFFCVYKSIVFPGHREEEHGADDESHNRLCHSEVGG